MSSKRFTEEFKIEAVNPLCSQLGTLTDGGVVHDIK